VISLGHPESSIVKIATEYNVGSCLTSSNPDELASQLLIALSAPNPAFKYRAEIRRCAAAEFDARRMRTVLFSCFRRCAEKTRGSVPG